MPYSFCEPPILTEWVLVNPIRVGLCWSWVFKKKPAPSREYPDRLRSRRRHPLSRPIRKLRPTGVTLGPQAGSLCSVWIMNSSAQRIYVVSSSKRTLLKGFDVNRDPFCSNFWRQQIHHPRDCFESCHSKLPFLDHRGKSRISPVTFSGHVTKTHINHCDFENSKSSKINCQTEASVASH